MVCWAGLNLLYLVGLLVLMKEPRTHVDSTGLRRAADSAREAPGVIRDGLSLLRHNRVLLALVMVELFWTAALVVFETFQPVRLAELVGGEEQAGALMGPVAAVGWGVFALGSAIAGISSRRIGVAWTAILARVLNGLGAITMGLVAGPAALIAAYLFTYGLHGTGGPMHSALLHREAQARNRATVISMNSMVFFIAFAVVASPARPARAGDLDPGRDGRRRRLQRPRRGALPARPARREAAGPAGGRPRLRPRVPCGGGSCTVLGVDPVDHPPPTRRFACRRCLSHRRRLPDGGPPTAGATTGAAGQPRSVSRASWAAYAAARSRSILRPRK